MNTRPTFRSSDPIQVGPFTSYNASHQRWRHQANPGRNDLIPAAFNVEDFVTPAAVAAIHKAFTLSKTSHDAWRSFKREGRFDPRRAPGAQRMEQDIFRRKTGRSTTKVRCAVLIDASGSMRYGEDCRLPNPLAPLSKRKIKVNRSVAAAAFGATVAKALSRIPTVDLDIYQHASSDKLIMKWRWSKGTPLGVFNESVHGIGGGGNADGHALYALTTKVLRDLKKGERGLIMVVSDGLPSDYSSDGTSQAGQALIDAVAHARRNGIEVIAVAIDGSDQSVYYGKDGVVPFTGDWGPLGIELAKHVGRALARR